MVAPIWLGGEDLNFVVLGSATITTTTSRYRSDYARCALEVGQGTVDAYSTPFPAGPVTACWFMSRFIRISSGGAFPMYGLGRSGTTEGVGIGLNANRCVIFKRDGTTDTTLATSVSTVFNGTRQKVDIEVINFSNPATGRVRVYVDQVLAVEYTGNLSAGSITDLDQVCCWYTTNGGGSQGYISELAVADDDTRLLSLKTVVPSAAGTANTFASGTYADIDGVTIDDATNMAADTVGQHAEVACTGMPAGDFSVKGFGVSARVSATVGGPQALALGIRTTDGAGTIDLGAPVTQTTAWATMDTLYATNPNDAPNEFTSAIIEAIELAFEAAA